MDLSCIAKCCIKRCNKYYCIECIKKHFNPVTINTHRNSTCKCIRKILGYATLAKVYVSVTNAKSPKNRTKPINNKNHNPTMIKSQIKRKVNPKRMTNQLRIVSVILAKIMQRLKQQIYPTFNRKSPTLSSTKKINKRRYKMKQFPNSSCTLKIKCMVFPLSIAKSQKEEINFIILYSKNGGKRSPSPKLTNLS